MKSQYRLVIATATAAAVIFTTSTSAHYWPVGDDGIAASPKVRQMLNARARSAATTQAAPAVASVGYRAVGADGIAASPKLRGQLNQRSRQHPHLTAAK